MFTVLYKQNGTRSARLGLAISKKHCKLAVGRNRIKRVVRESFRQQQTKLTGLDVVILNQPAAMRASNKALFDSLGKHWQKCHSAIPGGTEHTRNG
jgi:ribonuclease P protein component